MLLCLLSLHKWSQWGVSARERWVVLQERKCERCGKIAWRILRVRKMVLREKNWNTQDEKPKP